MRCLDGSHANVDVALYIIVSQNGMTALISASYSGQPDVAQALLAAGCEKEAKDNVGGDVVGMACVPGGGGEWAHDIDNADVALCVVSQDGMWVVGGGVGQLGY